MIPLPKHRPDRSAEMDAFLARSGWKGATRCLLAADASFRRYERVEWTDRVAVLMDAPPPWEDVHPFLQVSRLLAQCAVSVPNVYASDREEGFLLLEDFGDLSFTRLLREQPERELELYTAATDALIAMHMTCRARPVPFEQGLPAYDMTVYLREAALLAEWFLPQIHGVEKARALRKEYLELWHATLSKTTPKLQCIVHRDYHADNLFWLAEREGYRAVGMIDYQDALWGDSAYDLASLLEDARRDVKPITVAECFARYSTAIGEPAQDFAARFAVIAAQRNAKIIGIFTRLCVRDGKAQYLDYLPRVWSHFMRDLNHPMLAPIRDFIEVHVPQEWRGTFTPNLDIGDVEG